MLTAARRRAIPGVPPALVVGAGLVLGAPVVLYGAHRFGATVVLFGLAALAVAPALMTRPALLVAALPLLVVVFEADKTSLVHAPGQLYSYLPGLKITGVEAVAGLAAAAVAIRGVTQRRLWLPAPFGLPLLLVLVAIASGAVTGMAAGANIKPVFEDVRSIGMVVLVPFLVVNVVRTRAQLHRWLGGLAALTIAKSAVGLLALAIGRAPAILQGTPGTYLESTANLLAVLFLAAVLAAALLRAPVPRWVWWGTPIVFASLTLSYRRSFWIAALAALLLVIVAGSSRVGRRLLVPALVALIGFGWVLIGTGVGSQLDGTVVQRATSLSPAKVSHNVDDRYRIAERHNVWLDIRAHPIAGLGMDQSWTAREPMPVEHPNGRGYVHFAALWWWMTCGILGLIAYVALMGGTIALGFGLGRRAADLRVRAAALGTGAATVGLVLAELTATFVAGEARTTVLFGTVVGLLAAAWRTAGGGGDGAAATPARAGSR